MTRSISENPANITIPAKKSEKILHSSRFEGRDGGRIEFWLLELLSDFGSAFLYWKDDSGRVSPRVPSSVFRKSSLRIQLQLRTFLCFSICYNCLIMKYAQSILASFFFGFVASVSNGADKPKPEYQYESGDIRVSIPSQDEPRVASFGPDSIKAAVQYLEDGAVAWVRGKACVNCHTTGPYLTERTAWIDKFGQPNEEIYKNFASFVPEKVAAVKLAEKNGHVHYPGTFSSVWRSLGLAEWDRYVAGETSAATDRSLRDMFERQSESGAFVTHGEVEIPHITTDFELTLQAVRAVTAAPGWLDSMADESLKQRVEAMKKWLRSAPPKNDFDRVLKLQLAHYMPDLVPASDLEAAFVLLTSKQHSDGGWSIRDMSALDDWHFEMSDYVRDLIVNLPDAAKPASDPYMTALAIILLRQNKVPVSDVRIQRGLSWLKSEQRVSGRWWMHSLYRGNYHYITYIATAQAIKALNLCGEL